MDGITAKRILVALAKKMSCDSVRRANAKNDIGQSGYTLKFVKNGRSICVRKFVKAYDFGPIGYLSKASNWESLLNGLANMTIRPLIVHAPAPIQIHSIEQLAIDLELEGYLKIPTSKYDI